MRGFCDPEVLEHRGRYVRDRDRLGNDPVRAIAEPERAAGVVIAASHGVNHVEEVRERPGGPVTLTRDLHAGNLRFADAAATHEAGITVAADVHQPSLS